MVARIPDPDREPVEAPNVRPALPAPLLTRRRRAALKAVAVLPTMFTLGNLLCGFFAIFLASRDPVTAKLPFAWSPLTCAVVAVFIGMICDALDGRIARLTKQTSALGEQLDSFADMVSFGVAPAFIAIMLVDVHIPFLAEGRQDNLIDRAVLVTGGIYCACAALRLARFNVEVASPAVSDHMSFKGLPSPGAAGAVASVVLLHEHFLAPLMRDHITVGLDLQEESWPLWLSKIGMIVVMLLVAFAMVSRLRYVHVMNRYFRGKASFNTIVGCVVGALALAIVPLQYVIAGALVAYALSAPLAWLWFKTVGKKGDTDQMWVADDEGEDDDGEETA
jgi:CDP-diacylglycerol--serine O-phosphatidyltransferase